ncbi:MULTISPECIES: response regulator transcription factor [Stenotrophomonas]|jgi:two-component system capsular synthesis response regulator RcsB|uniref:Response regulator transcription factor n=1 Tax=Stenotrophomonas aracearum TaxID=3003272 RepID=A0ABY9YE47_9GAMM|nr:MULTISPECIES: response regulator transcription factor [unclassified Stenotrophomonas]WNH48975.1 response regulator transcription factor [Stenotrophomonas sp. A5588]
MTLRIIIADDHQVVRVGARAAIEASGVGVLVAEASNADELFAALEQHECDLLITDYSMPQSKRVDGIDMIQKIRRNYPDLRVLLMSVTQNIAILRMVVNNGVLGLFDKGSLVEELPLAIQAVSRGQPYVSRKLREIIDRVGTQSIGDDRTRVLSPREVEVLRLLSSGMTVKKIAEKLHKSMSTISRQKGDAMLKLGLRSDAELFDFMRDNKL